MNTAVTTGLLSKIERDFEKFDRENPEVWRLFCRFAHDALNYGARHRIGGKAVMERVRWSAIVEEKAKPFKVNNSYTSYYVRKWQSTYPQCAHVFETRKVKSDSRRQHGT